MTTFGSKRLRHEVWCGTRTIPWQDPTIELCPGHSCFLHNSFCLFDSCGPDSRIFIEIQRDPEEPKVVLLRPEHLPRLRAQLQMELAQIDELALRKGEIKSQLEDLDSAEQELKKQAGER
jgi:hypothetical protein